MSRRSSGSSEQVGFGADYPHLRHIHHRTQVAVKIDDPRHNELAREVQNHVRPCREPSARRDPIQEIRPLSMIIAAQGTGALPVPSIRVKFFSTFTSPRSIGCAAPTGRRPEPYFASIAFFQDSLCPRRVKHPAGAEPRHVSNRLCRCPPSFLHPIRHLFGKRMAHHAVTRTWSKAS